MQEPASFTRRFKRFTTRLHTTIAIPYIEGCIEWVNTLYGNAWFETTERIERRLVQLRDGKIDQATFDVEEEIFFERLQEFMLKYRKYKRLDDLDPFLKSLRQGD